MGTYVPLAAMALGGLPTLLLRTVALAALFAGLHQTTKEWTMHRAVFGPLLVVAGVLLGGPLGDSSLAAWAATGLVVGITLLAAYVLALRYDASPIIVAVGTMAVLAQLRDGAQQAFPGALYGGLLGALVTALVTWGVFRAVRSANARAAADWTLTYDLMALAYQDDISRRSADRRG